MATTAMTTIPQFSGLRANASGAPVQTLVSFFYLIFNGFMNCEEVVADLQLLCFSLFFQGT